MPRSKHVFRTSSPMHRTATWADAVVVVGLAVVLYAGVRLALGAPAAIRGPEISLAPSALPWYAGLSCLRMLAAYLLSLLFTLPYGYLAARNRRAEHVLLPLLDVLQSVPILSFLPVVLLSLTRDPARAAGRGAGGHRADLHQPGVEPDLCLVSVAHRRSPRSSARPVPPSASRLAPPHDPRTALRGHQPDLEQRDELGGRLVLPHGGRDLPRRAARLPPPGAGGLPARGGQPGRRAGRSSAGSGRSCSSSSCWTSSSGGRSWPGRTASSWRWSKGRARRPPGS